MHAKSMLYILILAVASLIFGQVQMYNGLISIIVPIYNKFPYLRRCFDSISRQTYRNLEIVLVNDGSTDASESVCREFQEKDKRFIYIAQSNKGPSESRKTGSYHARGEYITFIDADDWIEHDYIEKMSHYLDEAVDMVSSGMVWEDRGEPFKWMDSIPVGEYGRDSIVKYIIPNMLYFHRSGRQGIVSTDCTKIFRTDKLNSVFRKINIDFAFGEDALLVYYYILDACRIHITDICGYHYTQNEKSLLHQFSGKQFDEAESLLEEIRKMAANSPFSDSIEPQIKLFFLPFLSSLIKGKYHVHDICPWRYAPPFHIFPKGAKIALYGAGNVGRDYYYAFSKNSDFELVAWADRDYENIRKFYPVQNPLDLMSLNYDYILIAIESEATAEDARCQLAGLGIDKNKILWKPVYYLP